ncbi:high-affinity methionine permease [[Candida] railenensis]|uniref:High-affinity methionine permease n=1 Tax=[Candida] railenensis TaxID=45579 RepID=A0A9P0VX81_9ASCO|nr:high-affinity methionine permease [[Candida] railenensis]
MPGYLRAVLNPIIGAEKQKPDDYVEDDSSDAQFSIGAPVEKINPLGYNLDYFTAYFMALQGVIGTGIFANPASILKSIGSVGASYVLWVTGFIIAMLQILVYIEFVTYFKRRSGGNVVYLEQSYPKPKFLVASTYAAVSVILSFSTSSAIAFGSYILAAANYDATAWQQRGVGVAVLTFVCVLTIANSRLALQLSNLLGFIKTVFVIFIAITGLVVLGGNTRVENPTKVFHNSWEGTTKDGNAISNAIIKVAFSYGGTQYLFAIAGEADPRKTKNMFKYFLPGVMFSIFIFYLLIITAFYAGIGDVDTIKKSGSLVSAVFFKSVFGTEKAATALDVFVALSALGHLLAVVVGQSRSIRECGRQGVLPYASWWTTTKPWGTPVLPVIAIWIVNIIVLLAPPPGDAYNFVVDIGSYSGYIFSLLLVVGLLLVRKSRKAEGLGYEGFKVPLPIVVIVILYSIFVIALAWVPPSDGTLIGSDVSFFYAAYTITTVGLLLLCVAYYYVWGRILPKIFKYEHRTSYYTLENGEKGHTVIKVPYAELAEWDAHHDSNGRLLESDDLSSLNVVDVDHGEEIGKKASP